MLLGMKTAIATDLSSLAAAFTEWDRRFREDPERFQSESTRLLKSDPETYGDACAPYLVEILEEMKANRIRRGATSSRRRPGVVAAKKASARRAA